MGWFNRGNTAAAVRSSKEIAALVAPVAEARVFTPTAIPGPMDDGGRLAGLIAGGVGESRSMQQLAVYACVRLLADSIAGLPQDEYRKQGKIRVPLDPSPIISSPDPELTTFEYQQQVVTSLALRGNSYELVTGRDKFEWPIGRTPIHPDAVTIERDPRTTRLVYKFGGVEVSKADVIHIKRLTLAGATEGLSPIRQAAMTIGLALSAEGYGATWFNDSANPSAALETDANLDEVQTRQVMENWIATHGGRRHPALLSGGLKYRPISILPAESQFLETRAFQRGEIAMMFGVPPHMIGDTDKATSWGTGIEQQSLGFVKFTLMPWLLCIEAAYSRALLPRGRYMRFNVDAMLRGDIATRYAAYTQGRFGGWLNNDEIRASEDMEPIRDGLGQDYLQPLNYAPLGSVPTVPTPEAPAPATTGGDL